MRLTEPAICQVVSISKYCPAIATQRQRKEMEEDENRR